MRVAAITGGRGAIGTALAARLERDGWRVVALDLPGTGPVGPSAPQGWVPMDTTDPASVQAAFDEVATRFGRLDLLVVAAGVTALGSLQDTSDATFRRLMDINFHGAVACLDAARSALREARGHVAVLSSVAGFAPVVGRPAYVASKHALTATLEASRSELATDGIGLTLVHPTFVANELADEGGAGGHRSTTGRLVTPAAVADAIVEGVERERDRVLPGRTAWLAWHVNRLAPRLYRRLMTRRLDG